MQPLPSAQLEPDELVRFREQWKAEVRQKQAQGPPSSTRYTDAPTASDTDIQPGPFSQTISGVPVPHPAPSHANSSLGSAVELYRTAVRHEQRSELDDALRLYRQAFRMDPNVDRAYHREENLNVISAAPSLSHIPTSSAAVDEITHNIASLSAKSRRATVTGMLAGLLAGFPVELVFEREDEKEWAPFKYLPEEIIVLILRQLDPTSIERFALVNRKARVVSLDSAIWRELVGTIYKPPQVPDIESIDAVIDKYMCDFRRVFVEHPRVRLDGVYIAVCHYVRVGVSENAWANVSHLITYHRYLRFFPNGQVLSLLTNDDFSPQQLTSLLKPTLRMKGLFTGAWRLSGTTVEISDLMDANSKSLLPAADAISSHHSSPSGSPMRYTFRMTLNLRSRPLGRWNRLDLTAYESVEIGSGETVPVSLKHQRPFWFSKVRSYV